MSNRTGNLTNYHSHSLYCDGRANMEDFIRFALSEGTNHLIQQGAGIFVSVEDFLQELQLQPQNITTQIDFRKNLLEKDESLVYALLDFYPVGLGTLIEKSPYGLVEILPVLERLEQKGFIQETIPNYYIKTI